MSVIAEAELVDAMAALVAAQADEELPWRALVEARANVQKAINPNLVALWHEKRQVTLAAFQRARDAQLAVRCVSVQASTTL